MIVVGGRLIQVGTAFEEKPNAVGHVATRTVHDGTQAIRLVHATDGGCIGISEQTLQSLGGILGATTANLHMKVLMTGTFGVRRLRGGIVRFSQQGRPSVTGVVVAGVRSSFSGSNRRRSSMLT
jgi:hypothetical protein